jgi:uncharacterized protein (TIGR04141 family)
MVNTAQPAKPEADGQRSLLRPPRTVRRDSADDKASTYRTTVYRLTEIPNTEAHGLRTGLNHKYLRKNGFIPIETEVAGAPALLIHGHVPQASADWCPIITALTGEALTVAYSSAGGALLVRVDEQVYALTYGVLGRFFIAADRIDPGFGIQFALRAIEPDRIQRVTRRVLASTGRVDRNLVPGGQPIRRYDIEGWGEIVRQLSGVLANERLTVTRGSTRRVTFAGADSLQIPVSTDPVGLLADLREIGRTCVGESPCPELDFIAQIRPLPSGERTAELDKRLDEMIGIESHPDVGLAVPTSLIELEPLAGSYLVRMPYRKRLHLDLDLEAVVGRARGKGNGRRLNTLKHGSIELCNDPDGDEPLAPPVKAHLWITAEVPLGAARMIYQEGQWYQIGEQHLALLNAEIEEILTQPATLVLPPWTGDLEDEDAYNRHVAETYPGFVLLDKKTLRTKQHNRGPGIEACDLLGPNDELIHVKRAAKSAPLSHLFTQGEVSVDALLHEPDAREKLAARVRADHPDHHIDETFRPRKVIYAIALASGKQLSPKTLFTFSQVALYRATRRLRGANIEVEIISIPVVP